jgi:hypothetical protein
MLKQFYDFANISAVANPGVLASGTIVFVGRDASNNWYATISTDGITWSSSAPATVAAISVAGTVLYGGKLLSNALFYGANVGSAAQAVLIRSTDGITWSTIAPTGFLGSILAVSHGGTGVNNYLAISENTSTLNRNVASSADGLTWTTRAAGITAQPNACASSSTAHVIVTSAGSTGANIYSSTDSITWAARTSPTSSISYNIAWGNGRFVAPTDNGDVIYSTDGTTWSFGVQAKPTITAGTSNNTIISANNYNSTFIFADGYFWCTTTHQWAASVNSMAFSTDGITWDRTYFNTAPSQSTSAWGPNAQGTPTYLNYSSVYGSIFGATSTYQSTASRVVIVVPKPIYVEIYNVSGTTL